MKLIRFSTYNTVQLYKFIIQVLPSRNTLTINFISQYFKFNYQIAVCLKYIYCYKRFVECLIDHDITIQNNVMPFYFPANIVELIFKHCCWCIDVGSHTFSLLIYIPIYQIKLHKFSLKSRSLENVNRICARWSPLVLWAFFYFCLWIPELTMANFINQRAA